MPVLANDIDKQNSSQQRDIALWWRVGTLLIFVIALVLILISFLNYSNYCKTYLELNLTRNLVLAKDLRQTVETGLNIGLQPEENVRLLPAIKELAERHSGIRYVGVVQESGAIIGVGTMPAGIAQDWKTWRDKNNAYWQTGDTDTFQIGMPFVNNFNITAGAVVIAYDKIAIERAIGDMALKLSVDVLLTLALLAILTLGGVYALTRTFSRQLENIGYILDGSLKGASPALMGKQVLADDVAQDIDDFTALSHAAMRELAALEQAINLPVPGDHGRGQA